MKRLKRSLGRFRLVQALYNVCSRQVFPGSLAYWENRYKTGRSSGAGSYRALALYKADIVNALVRERDIQSVIEFGCGDGNQLSLLEFPCYTGLDVSRTALQTCIDRFKADESKSFFLYDPRAFADSRRMFHADLSLSLDVIFHLVEDDFYHRYMSHLFGAADRSVIVYSSNDERGGVGAHVRHRRFTDWVSQNASEWILTTKIDNRYPLDPRRPDQTSFADFYVFDRGHSSE